MFFIRNQDCDLIWRQSRKRPDTETRREPRGQGQVPRGPALRLWSCPRAHGIMGCLWDTILVWRATERPIWPLAFILLLLLGCVSTGSRLERRMKTRRDRAASHTRRFSPSSPSAPVWARRRSPGRWRGSRRQSPRSPSPRTTHTPASLSRCHLGNTRTV